jgi:uncharacterized protein GlcG (DUF336 family)
MPRAIQTVSFADRREMIAAGERKAQEPGIRYDFAVVDAGGALIAHARMDGAWLGSIAVAASRNNK